MNNGAFSKEFTKRWKRFYGKSQTIDILKALQRDDPKVLAPNILKIGKTELRENLEKVGFRFEDQDFDESLVLKREPFKIVSTPEYLAGLFSIQAQTSLIPPKSLNPTPGKIIADLAASPGIKTSILAQIMKNTGTIFAFEKSQRRLPALKANIARMGIFNTIILHCDALNISDLNTTVDHILLDAPCSGTGLKQGKNKRIEKRVIRDISRHANIQRQMLEKAWSQLKVEGTLVYSTCSLEPEEGEFQIDQFVEKHENEVEILSIPFKYGVSGIETKYQKTLNPQIINTRRIFPSLGLDGFFIALLKRVSN
ncbi:MAG: RsmB/NOP family class I SAM-dependent RNA methyltransferase [Candidatus Heimdallarchaeota archaeon]|nr:RsmB/NOP family class I SAM-dependent RNA methyltransferase [Candidatus Heimdallarchaeota archaeon]